MALLGGRRSLGIMRSGTDGPMELSHLTRAVAVGNEIWVARKRMNQEFEFLVKEGNNREVST